MNTNDPSNKGAVDTRKHAHLARDTQKKADQATNITQKERLTDLANQHRDIAKGNIPK